ncbi:MAG: hypothetical protein BMS9Abin28_0526 [Anaerolineae bacterium]|nr:MAG: hypothetical protein BMS9Abin28_0526 [Anaerolineae bacterium]
MAEFNIGLKVNIRLEQVRAIIYHFDLDLPAGASTYLYSRSGNVLWVPSPGPVESCAERLILHRQNADGDGARMWAND